MSECKKIICPSIKDEVKDIKIFFGNNSGIQRFDFYHYPQSKKLERQQRGAFWNPDEVSLKNDILHYYSLPTWVRAIFESNISFQTLMDSGNNKGLDEALIPLVTSPEIEALLKTQSYFELIHSLSYAHNLITVFPDPGKIYDNISLNKFIQHRVDKEIDIYTRLQDLNIDNENLFQIIARRLEINKEKSNIPLLKKVNNLLNDAKKIFIKLVNKKVWEDESKKTILEALIRINALEGLKFYVSFLMTYKINDEFGNKIPGATKIIKLINFDEDLHVSIFQFLINTLKKEKREGFTHLFEKNEESSYSFFEEIAYKVYKEVYQDEVEWGKYLLNFADAIKEEVIELDDKKEVKRTIETVNLLDTEKVEEYKSKGWFVSEANTIPGLTFEVLDNFMKFYTNVRLEGIGLKPMFENAKKDMTVEWFQKYKDINSERTAAQETEILSYSIGQLVDDVMEDNNFDSELFDTESYLN